MHHDYFDSNMRKSISVNRLISILSRLPQDARITTSETTGNMLVSNKDYDALVGYIDLLEEKYDTV